MAMAAVIIGSRWKGTRERVNPGARADTALVAIQAGRVWIGAARTEMAARLATTGVTIAADEVFQCKKGVFHP